MLNKAQQSSLVLARPLPYPPLRPRAVVSSGGLVLPARVSMHILLEFSRAHEAERPKGSGPKGAPKGA